MKKSIQYLLIPLLFLLSGYNHLFASSDHKGDRASVNKYEHEAHANSSAVEGKLETFNPLASVLSKGQNESLNESPLEIAEEDETDELVPRCFHLEGHVYTVFSSPLRLRSYQYFSSVASCRYILLHVFRI